MSETDLAMQIYLSHLVQCPNFFMHIAFLSSAILDYLPLCITTFEEVGGQHTKQGASASNWHAY